jgi:hypothetical protein
MRNLKFMEYMSTSAVFALLGFAILFVYGYIINIVDLAHATSFSGLVVLRTIGILFMPLGAILGYL